MGIIKALKEANKLSLVEQGSLSVVDPAALRQELREKWAQNKPPKNHNEDAFFFHGIDNDGRLDSTENPELMSITIKYFETIEEAQKGNVKELRLWAYKEDTEKYARGILEAE